MMNGHAEQTTFSFPQMNYLVLILTAVCVAHQPLLFHEPTLDEIQSDTVRRIMFYSDFIEKSSRGDTASMRRMCNEHDDMCYLNDEVDLYDTIQTLDRYGTWSKAKIAKDYSILDFIRAGVAA